MKVLIVGEGAKEQALAFALEFCGNHEVLVVPGNPGTEQFEASVNDLPVDFDPENVIEAAYGFAPDFIMMCDEDFVRSSLKTKLPETRFPIVAPDTQAVKLLDDKPQWCSMMREMGLPVADFELFSNREEAERLINRFPSPFVFKELGDDGKYAVPYDENEAMELLDEWFAQGETRLMISEFQNGVRFNLPALIYHDRVLPLDTLRIQRGIYEFEDDAQSKGMGAFSPATPFLDADTQEKAADILRSFFIRLYQEGKGYQGFVSGEFVNTAHGPVCVNLKPGLSDSGAAALFLRAKSDLALAWQALCEHELPTLEWNPQSSVSIVLAAKQYPDQGSHGHRIVFGEDLEIIPYCHHVSRNQKGEMVTDGGRVLMVATLGKDLSDASVKALGQVEHIFCPDLFYRRDIGTLEV